MNHQPFEDWIFEEELDRNQLKLLKSHLSECEDCRQLQTALKGIDRMFDAPDMLAPRAGFSQRWEDFAEGRHEKEETLSAWLVLGALVIAAVSIVLANFGRIWFADINILQMSVSNLVNVINVANRFADTILAARTVIQVIPFSFVLFFAAGAGMLAFFWVSIWLFALRRISSVQRRVQ
jgi:hypothetical protein